MDKTQRMTRKGVVYNLYESPFMFTNEHKLTFIFSSNFNKQRFKISLKENRDNLENLFSKRLGFTPHLSSFYDIALYLRIERRSFLLRLESGEYICQNDLILDGDKAVRIKQTL